MAYVFLGLVIIIAGILFYKEKLLRYIPDFNPDEIEESQKWLVSYLCKNIGIVMTIPGFFIMIAGVSAQFKSECFALLMVIWVVATLIDTAHINKKIAQSE